MGFILHRCRKGLHRDCFYGLTYEEEYKLIIERTKEYIDLIDDILKKFKHQPETDPRPT